MRHESNVRMIYESHQIHVHSSIGPHVSKSFTSFMNLTKFMSSRHFHAPACQQPQQSVRGDVHNCKFCCRTHWDLSRPPPQQCENICPFLTITREIRKRCHTYILRKSPFIDSHHTIGLVYFPTAIPPELAFTGIHCFKILFPAIDPYVHASLFCSLPRNILPIFL